MSIVIDVNALGCVLSRDNKNHAQFAPVLQWISKREGKMVMGGTTYAEELSKCTNLLGRSSILAELERRGRIVRIDPVLVDARTSDIRKQVPNASFNDPHIVALLCVSGCMLLCTSDKSGDKYFKDRALYEDRRRRHIYRSRDGKHLLCKKWAVQLRNTV